MSAPVCTPTKEMTEADRHELFKRMYGATSTSIQAQVVQGYSWPEIKVALLACSRMSNYLLHACQQEAAYWRNRL